MMSPAENEKADPMVRELLAVEKAFGDALVAADVSALERIVADDWIIVGPDGQVIERTAFVAVVKSGALTHTSMDFGEARVRVYGETAIVTGRAVSVGAYQGQAFTTTERSTDVFVRVHGTWKCVLT